MSGEKNFFEVGISRHAPKEEKPGELIDTTKQEVDKESAAEGITQRAEFILQNLEQAPAGAIMAFMPSNVKRAEQTRNLFIEKIKELLVAREDIEAVELGADQELASQLLSRINSETDKKFIISDLRGTQLIGFKEDDKYVPAVNTWKNKLKGDESLLAKVWAAHPEEIPGLIEELQQAGADIRPEEVKPQEFQVTPEERSINFVRWIKAMKKIGESRFPNRPLILEGISHNMAADFTALALLDQDISVASINKVLGGKLREFFERSNITFSGGDDIKIKYRDAEKEWTTEEFEELINKIKEKMASRKKEWQELSATQ